MDIRLNQACRERLKIVEKMAAQCPAELATDIMVTGSVSRGLSDDNSDIEILFLANRVLPEERRIEWIREIGGREIQSYSGPIGDRSEWLIFRYEEYWVEAGWQPVTQLTAQLEQILSAQEYSHDKLRAASIIQYAIGVRDSGLLAIWQAALRQYPTPLQQAILSSTIAPWTLDLGIQVRRVLASRDDRIPLLERIIADVHRVLRILFAVNRQWEPDWKWIPHIVEQLAIRPPRLAERINTIVCLQDPEACVQDCFALIRDTLLLLPDEWQTRPEVQRILENVG